MLDQPLIKILLLVAVVVITAMLNRSTADSRHQAVRRLLLVGFVLLAAAAVLFPRLLTQVAQVLGVGRGADLLLYGLTVVFLGYVASSYRRMRHMEQQVTTLARELALRAAIHDAHEHPRPPEQGQPPRR
jgi:small membrane protein